MKKNIAFVPMRLILVIGFAFASLLASAQDYIDEDFLGNLETNAHTMLDEPAPDFKTNATPAKWDKESAVVIGYSRNILFDRKSLGGFLMPKEQNLWFVEKDHFKIRLNDNNSVDAFSEIQQVFGAVAGTLVFCRY